MTVVDTQLHRDIADMVHVREHPSLAERELVHKVRTMFDDARTVRKPLIRRWAKSRKMLLNRYWVTDGRPAWMPSPQVPEIWPIVNARVGWMTDQRIRHTVAPSSVPNSPYHSWQIGLARDLAAVMDATWFVNCEEQDLTKMLVHAEMYGTGILKTVWDPLLAGGIGDAIQRSLDPHALYPDPQARNFGECNFIVEAKNIPLQTLDRLYPGAWKLLKYNAAFEEPVDESPDQLNGAGVQRPKANAGAVAPATTPRWGMPGQTSLRSWDRNDKVTVLEAWIREHTVTNGRVRDMWRLVVVAGERVLLNEPVINLWRHGQHPYSRYVPFDLGEFWGVGMVELLTSPQEAINRLLAAMQHNVELHGNPIWLEGGAGRGTARTPLSNKPGQRLEGDKNNVGWVQPPGLNPGMADLVRHMLQRMEAVSGLSSITRGGSPGGRNAQGVIDSLQEAAFVTIRQQQRQLEFTLRDSGKKKAALICENYTTPRNVAIAGPQGEQTSLALNARHFIIPTAEGGSPLDYELFVDAGSGTHTSRKVREEKAMALFGIGAIDHIALLEALDWPNARETAQRSMQQQMQGVEPPGARQRTGR